MIVVESSRQLAESERCSEAVSVLKSPARAFKS
jgi:hypothetical protein